MSVSTTHIVVVRVASFRTLDVCKKCTGGVVGRWSTCLWEAPSVATMWSTVLMWVTPKDGSGCRGCASVVCCFHLC